MMFIDLVSAATIVSVDQECDEEKGPVSVVKVSGCVVHFTGLSGDKSREDIREDLLPFGTVAFVDFDRGKTEVSISVVVLSTAVRSEVCVMYCVVC